MVLLIGEKNGSVAALGRREAHRLRVTEAPAEKRRTGSPIEYLLTREGENSSLL